MEEIIRSHMWTSWIWATSELTLDSSQTGDECGTAGRRGAGAVEASPLVHGGRCLYSDLMLEVCKMQHAHIDRCKKAIMTSEQYCHRDNTPVSFMKMQFAIRFWMTPTSHCSVCEYQTFYHLYFLRLDTGKFCSFQSHRQSVHIWI